MLEFNARAYRLVFPSDRPFVYLESPAGKRLADLFILSSVHPWNGRDDTPAVAAWQHAETPSETVFTLSASSSAWQAKTYRLRCTPERLSYEIEVNGQGQLAEANYFGGYSSANIRWGSGFFWSGQAFRRGFNPEPNSRENYHFSPDGTSRIDLTGVPLPGKADWFFTPPPFCFALEFERGWVTLGVEAAPGGNCFTSYSYHGQPGAFSLSLAYDGQTRVDGCYRLPAIGFDFAADEYAALEKHVIALRASGCAPAPAPAQPPAWWQTPIFCGWGAQCQQAAQQGGRAPDFSRQQLYNEFLDALARNGIDPGIIVLDDKWQATYGDNRADQAKWPDLPAFIARQHTAGRKVLLWLKAWDPEGLPVEECIVNAAGLPVAFDPTHPAFQGRLRAAVRRMLSPDGYDADGFKIDFTARIPCGPGLRLAGEGWGLELLKTYLTALHAEAKQVKPEALIMTHTPHPYLADVVDMIRLNDINTGASVNPAMRHRARVASIACPQALIDTDNWPMPNKAAWRAYLQIQPDLGVPSLYFATHIDSTGEALEPDDYRLIRETWARSAKRIQGEA